MPPIPLREAHAHLPAFGETMSRLQLAHCRTRDECLDLVRERAAAMDAARAPDWMVANGARPQGWTDPRWPTRQELTAACPNRPALVMGFDFHSGAVNDAALAACGFHPRSADPPGGVLVRDASGEATGVLLERAFTAAREAIPPASPAARMEHVRRACRALMEHGFFEVHDLLAPTWLGPALAELDRAGELPLRVLLYPALQDLPEVVKGAAAWQSPRVRLAGGKIFVDGTLNSRTAWMLSPFVDGLDHHPHGTPLLSVGQIVAAIRACRERGLGLAAHAIGDGAVRAVLDAAEAVGGGLLEGDCGPGHIRIEHLEIVDEADVPRFARQNVIASVQPCHLLYDIEVLRRHLPHRLERVLPLRELLSAGLQPGRTLLFGSDVPIVRPDPQDSILAATQRRRSDMPTSDAIAPSHALSESEAWACFRA